MIPSEFFSGTQGTQYTDSVVSDQPPIRALDGVLNPRFWENPGSAGFKVRGPNYLKDRKKIPTSQPKFNLDWVYLVRLQSPLHNIGHHLPALRWVHVDIQNGKWA